MCSQVVVVGKVDDVCVFYSLGWVGIVPCVRMVCSWEGFEPSQDGEAPWIQFSSKLLVTLLWERDNNYYEGIELKMGWVILQKRAMSSRMWEVIVIVGVRVG